MTRRTIFHTFEGRLSGLADCSVVPSGPDTLLAVAPNAEALYMFSVLGGTPSGF